MSVSVSFADLTDQRIEYPAKSPTDFLSLRDYLKISEHMIKKHCSGSALFSMLHSEDAVSYIAERIMFADWRWRPEFNVSKRAYRSYCVKMALRSYFSKSNNRKNKQLKSIYDDSKLYSQLSDKTLPQNNACTEVVQFLLRNSGLTDIQHQCVSKYYLEGLNFSEIGVQLNVSKQAVEQNVKKAIRNIQTTTGVQNA